MKNKYVELKIPIGIMSKVEKVKKNTPVHSNMSFSDYVNMLILRALDDEAVRIKDYEETVKMSRKRKSGVRKIIAFTKNR